MVLPAFNADELRTRLNSLNSSQQLAFGAMCCERLLPNYDAFRRDADWGDLTPIRNALDFVWSFLVSKVTDTKDIESHIKACESVAPDSEDFDSLYVSSAQDACFAVCGLLDFLLENDVDKIVQAAAYATSTVDLYVQEIEGMTANGAELEEKILNHHLMQRELAEQEKNLSDIGKATALNSELIEFLKQSWNNGGKSNLNIP